MSINVPEKLSKKEYNGLLNDLKKYDLISSADLSAGRLFRTQNRTSA